MEPKTESRLTINSASPQDTQRLGKTLAGVGLQPSDVIALSGPLGAGKTVFVKGLAEGLGVAEGRVVTSPTFVLLNKYPGALPLYHFDAYRLRSASDMREIGCEEIFFGAGVSVVEWADRVPECLPEVYLDVHLDITGPTSRRIVVTPHGERWNRAVMALRERLRLFN